MALQHIKPIIRQLAAATLSAGLLQITELRLTSNFKQSLAIGACFGLLKGIFEERTTALTIKDVENQKHQIFSYVNLSDVIHLWLVFFALKAMQDQNLFQDYFTPLGETQLVYLWTTASVINVIGLKLVS